MAGDPDVEPRSVDIDREERRRPKPQVEGFKHTHFYDPIGWDRFDPKPHPGSNPIRPGSPVQNMGRVGPGTGGGRFAFRHVRDASGNSQSVHGTSLKSKKAFLSQQESISPAEAKTLGYKQYQPQEGDLFHDRRGEGRRDRPT
jgi:hypothetical protein